ncbi:MAG: nucleotide pyrophosphohydrolase [Bacteroidota bacterium]
MQKIIDALVHFRDERDWGQFHDPRNLSLALSLEAAELNEHFLWKKDTDDINIDGLKEELADVFAYAFLLADRCGFDVEEIVMDKIKKNALKYPVDKSKGSATKYDRL